MFYFNNNEAIKIILKPFYERIYNTVLRKIKGKTIKIGLVFFRRGILYKI
jgi:hypothetical protein